jgi:hypothetical protein
MWYSKLLPSFSIAGAADATSTAVAATRGFMCHRLFRRRS